MDGPRFNMKGNAWRGVQEYVAKEVGLSTVLEALTPETRRFFSQSFVASVWYDILPAAEIVEAVVALSGRSKDAVHRALAQFVFERDVNGIYRAILRFATPELMVRALPLATSRYFDFIGLETTRVGPRAYDVQITGIPARVAALYAALSSVFIELAIAGSGGKNVSAQTLEPTPEPALNGTPTVRIVRQLRWS